MRKDFQQGTKPGNIVCRSKGRATSAEPAPKQLIRTTPSCYSPPPADWAFIALLSYSNWCNFLIPALLFPSFHSSSSFSPSLGENPLSFNLTTGEKISLKAQWNPPFSMKEKSKSLSEEQVYHSCTHTDCFIYTLCMIFYPSHSKYSFFQRIRIFSYSVYAKF